MINEMSAHASMYIPLSIPPTQLPQYVHIDRNSQWHTSALLSAALESFTLPTRLRHDAQKRGFIDDLEAALNVNGNQRIAQLQCSILNPSTSPLISTHGCTDNRAPLGSNRILVEEDSPKLADPRLDMDFSGCKARSTSPFVIQHDKSDHVFGAVETTRTRTAIETANDEEMDKDEINYARKRRRFAGLPVIERFVTPELLKIPPIREIFLTQLIPCRYYSPLEYPLLDSFPPIFSLSPGLTHVVVHTSLSTTSGISNRVKALQRMVSRSANLDEREALSNGLGEISEAYEDGWHSGSEESDD